MAKYIFGIDLGTTYSCISYVKEDGQTEVVKNNEGELTTPSVVNFEGEDKVNVGSIAKENSIIFPDTTVSKVKPLMGRSKHAFTYNGQSKSPEEISAHILRKLAQDAGKYLDTEVKDVVITCPAYFGTEERTATKNAGKIAGLNVIEVISEPTAAALLYGCDKVKEGEKKTILVYDLGGGTFDITVMHIAAKGSEDREIKVVCYEGDHELGGKDWDDRIVSYAEQKFRDETGYKGELDSFVRKGLELAAEKAKKQLSSRNDTYIPVEVGKDRARIKLTLETFEAITEDLLNQTLDKTAAAIEVAKKEGHTIDEIILVGGSTRMPMVPRALEARFGIKPKEVMDPDEAVARGAAIYALCAYQLQVEAFLDSGAAVNGLPPERPTVDPKLIPGLRGTTSIRDVITVAATKSYALEIQIPSGELRCDNIILKNTPMEDGIITVTKQYGTVANNQTNVQLQVFESDITEPMFEVDQDLLLGTAVLELEGNLPAGAPIQVTFSLDREGILKMTGRDVTTGREITVEMQAKPGTILSDAEVEELRRSTRHIAVE